MLVSLAFTGFGGRAIAETTGEIERRLDDLSEQAGANAARQSRLAGRIGELRSERVRLEAQLASAQARAEESGAELEKMAITAYKTGGESYLASQLTAFDGEADDFITRQAYISRLTSRIRRVTNESSDAAHDTEIALADIDSVEAEESAQLDDLIAAESDLEAALAQQRRLYEQSLAPPPPPPPARQSSVTDSPTTAGSSGTVSAPPRTTPPRPVAPGPPTSDSITAHLARIAMCESGGNPRAVSASGQYRGKYQFSYATWAAVGGSGDPAAAPESEQDMRARMLYERSGPGQWPRCQ